MIIISGPGLDGHAVCIKYANPFFCIAKNQKMRQKYTLVIFDASTYYHLPYVYKHGLNTISTMAQPMRDWNEH